MKYKIVRLDGRWSYRQHFEHAIIFSNRMTSWKGPQNFSVVQQYFFDTYGWSAEIRQWSDMQKHYTNPYMYVGTNPSPEMPSAVNRYWSWTNGYDDLRIYVKSSKELTLFQLKYPVDQ